MNKLNVNPYLFGCCNGMLELRAKDAAGKESVIFRQGRPEDYVSFLAGRIPAECHDPIPYIPYDPHHPIQHEITDFLTKVFPNPELRAYVLRLLSSCLEGANREQCYYTLIGGGGNGKSKIVELMRLALGDYQTSMSTTVLTRKRPDSGAANPEIIVSHGQAEYQEGCLSVPGAYDTVVRADKVTVRAQDRHGKTFEIEAEGLLGECFQHEIDHLNGKLFLDLLSPIKRAMARKKMDKYKRSLLRK